MRNAEDIRKYFEKSTLSTNAERHEAVFEQIQRAQDQSKDTAPELTGPEIRNRIMKSRIAKLATAAVIAIVVVLGLLEFIGDGPTSGVVWAEVVSRVEASRGLIVRSTDVSPSNEDEYSITYTSPAYCRRDFYRDAQIIRTAYVDFTGSDTDTLTDVFHLLKLCQTITFRKKENGLFLEWHNDWTNPGFLVQKILSAEHRKLGQKTIEGALCEGIETTDPACFGPVPEELDNLQVEFRLWVSVETGYPIMYETKLRAERKGKVQEQESVMDQFQWNVELDPNIFEPTFPPDYTQDTRPGIVE
jgi:hypothetical protein